MAALFPRNSSEKVLLLFVSCLSLHTFYSTEFLAKAKAADLVDEVCSHTVIDPEFCKNAFHSDPRYTTADLSTLAQIGINLASSYTKSSTDLVDSLKNKATDPKLKEIYSSCLENYQDTSENLKGCTSALNQKDYPTLNIRASAALDGPATCDDSFSNPSEPEQLQQSGKQVRSLCAAICYIANKLPGSVENPE